MYDHLKHLFFKNSWNIQETDKTTTIINKEIPLYIYGSGAVKNDFCNLFVIKKKAMAGITFTMVSISSNVF